MPGRQRRALSEFLPCLCYKAVKLIIWVQGTKACPAELWLLAWLSHGLKPGRGMERGFAPHWALPHMEHSEMLSLGHRGQSGGSVQTFPLCSNKLPNALPPSSGSGTFPHPLGIYPRPDSFCTSVHSILPPFFGRGITPTLKVRSLRLREITCLGQAASEL